MTAPNSAPLVLVSLATNSEYALSLIILCSQLAPLRLPLVLMLSQGLPTELISRLRTCATTFAHVTVAWLKEAQSRDPSQPCLDGTCVAEDLSSSAVESDLILEAQACQPMHLLGERFAPTCGKFAAWLLLHARVVLMFDADQLVDTVLLNGVVQQAQALSRLLLPCLASRGRESAVDGDREELRACVVEAEDSAADETETEVSRDLLPLVRLIAKGTMSESQSTLLESLAGLPYSCQLVGSRHPAQKEDLQTGLLALMPSKAAHAMLLSTLKQRKLGNDGDVINAGLAPSHAKRAHCRMSPSFLVGLSDVSFSPGTRPHTTLSIDFAGVPALKPWRTVAYSQQLQEPLDGQGIANLVKIDLGYWKQVFAPYHMQWSDLARRLHLDIVKYVKQDSLVPDLMSLYTAYGYKGADSG